MKIIKPLLTLAIAGTVALGADAIVAKRDVRTVTQPDGTQLRVRLVGDETMHFLLTEDGTLLTETDGVYTYGRVNAQGVVESTGVLATMNPAAGVATVNLSDLDVQDIAARRGVAKRRMESHTPYGTNAPEGMKRIAQTGKGMVSSTYPSTGSPKGLILLVEYSDVKFTLPNPGTYFNDMINKPGFSENGGTGSALDYFKTQSNGVFVPSFDVLGPVTLSNKRSYYGGNSGGGDIRPYAMVTEGCRALDATVDFSKYDTDGDGLIDNVYVIYAGQGEASYGPAESVWPHSWDVRYAGANVVLDGVTLAHYACSNEWERNAPDGIGTFCHEFSHVMGLPDLYDTEGSLTCTPGAYSALDYGPYNNDGRTPPNYGAYERNAMGWQANPVVLDGPMTVTLDPITSNQFALIPTASANEFFLLENRQKEGWDAYIPGHGLLIWHIDYQSSKFTQNVVNNNRSHQYVDIEEANNTANNSSAATMAGWTFPGTAGKTSFTATTTPALKAWDGTAIDMPITNIREEDGLVTFDAAGGGATLDVPAPTVSTGSNSDKHFTATWPAVAGAVDYYLTVTACAEGESGTQTADFTDSTLPAGWSSSASSIATYATTGNYGESSPSLKLSTDGQTITSPVIPSDAVSISFWHKGMTVSGGTSIRVEGNINGEWVLLKNVEAANMAANTETITDIPTGVRQVRFVMYKNKGNIALDDINITYGGKDEILPDYNNASTGGKNTVVVDKLRQGVSKYYFTVRATDGKLMSRVSDPVYVTVNGMSGVENVAVDATEAPAEYYNLQGVRVANPAAGQIYIERRGNTARKVRF